MSNYCKNCYELTEKLEAKEQECETLASQLDFEVQKKECLEQECKKLKSQIEIYSNMLESSSNKILKKEEECEELKAYAQRQENQREEYYKEYLKLSQECEELKKKCNIYTCGICGNKEDCNKLYKTLTEIKEIAEGHNANAYCNSKIDMRKILQKISECEVEND